MRFPGFEEDWETVGFGSYISFKTTNSFSRENLNYGNGTVKNIHYGDIHTQFQTLFDVTKEKVPFIDKGLNISRISEDSFCKEGDIIFADASENLNDVGKSIEIVNLNDEKVLSGLHTLLARPIENKFEKGFLGYLLKSKNARLQIQKESQGSKVLSINAGRLSKISLSYPNNHEQKRIANFFSLLDEKIETQKKTISELEKYIQILRDELFSQKIRFNNHLNEHFPKWSEQKLEDICEKQSSSISANSIEDNIGEFPIFGATGFLKNIDFYQVESEYIAIIKDGAGVGRMLYCKEKSSVLGTLDILKAKDVNLQFLFYLLSRIDFSKYSTGSTIPHIYFKDYKNEKVLVPCVDEQNRIATFLSKLSEKILIESKIMNLLKQQKKYLLQNLFI